MILVAGATGYLGSEICRLLSERGQRVRALVRQSSNSEKIERLRALGVDFALGDLKDPRSLDAACHDVDTVISTASVTLSRQPDDSIQRVDNEGQIALVDAAVSNGVERYLYVSFSGNLDLECALNSAKRTVERAVRNSGMTYTILRPSFFVEIWLSPALGFDVEHGKARIFGTGDQRMSWISLADVARFTVECVDHPAAENAVFELGGEAISPNELIAEVERRTGKSMDVERVPAEALHAQRAQAKDAMEHSFATLMLGYAQGDEVDLGPARQLHVPIRSAREFIAR
ncbi:MAG: SDR family oxidoreductase [Gemmatimonadota bacterium]|nr:SDR family oxidoreductase [Gemmatimonadota bacterium]